MPPKEAGISHHLRALKREIPPTGSLATATTKSPENSKKPRNSVVQRTYKPLYELDSELSELSEPPENLESLAEPFAGETVASRRKGSIAYPRFKKSGKFNGMAEHDIREKSWAEVELPKEGVDQQKSADEGKKLGKLNGSNKGTTNDGRKEQEVAMPNTTRLADRKLVPPRTDIKQLDIRVTEKPKEVSSNGVHSKIPKGTGGKDPLYSILKWGGQKSDN